MCKTLHVLIWMFTLGFSLKKPNIQRLPYFGTWQVTCLCVMSADYLQIALYDCSSYFLLLILLKSPLILLFSYFSFWYICIYTDLINLNIHILYLPSVMSSPPKLIVTCFLDAKPVLSCLLSLIRFSSILYLLDLQYPQVCAFIFIRFAISLNLYCPTYIFLADYDSLSMDCKQIFIKVWLLS